MGVLGRDLQSHLFPFLQHWVDSCAPCSFRCFACWFMDFLVCCSGTLPMLFMMACTASLISVGFLITCRFSQFRNIEVRSPSNHPPARSNSFVHRILLAIIFSQIRIGEAKVPGPEEAAWKIGTCNPAGLPHKADLIGSSQVDLWLISETHLSYQGCKSFQNQLRAMQSHHRWLVPGKHVVPRSTTSDHGSWSGVAALSKHPTRRLPVPWSFGAFDTSRIVASTSHIAGLWISGCVVYGVATGPTHPRAKRTTDLILSEAVSHLRQMTGPRYVAGDFNHDLDELPSIEALHSMNFIEVQDLYMTLTGVAPQPTCKRKTRRDYLFISAELVPLFVGVKVDHDQWIDHATIVAEFRGGRQDFVRYPWPKPQPLPWHLLDPQVMDCQALPSFQQTPDCTAAYRDFWQAVEQHVVECGKEAGQSIRQASLGRGAALKPKVVKGTMAPLRASRNGDVTPQFFGLSWIHKHWFRQLRRLQSYMYMAKGGKVGVTLSEHQAQLWGAICRAPGFAPSFLEWWPSRPNLVEHRAVVSPQPPSLNQIIPIFQEMQGQVRFLEQQLTKQNRQRAQLPHLSRLYKAVASQFQRRKAVIQQVEANDISIGVDPPQEWIEDRPILVNGSPLKPLVITSDQLWLENVDNLEEGQTVVQPNPQGKLEVMFEQFIQYWRKFWCKHADVPMSQLTKSFRLLGPD